MKKVVKIGIVGARKRNSEKDFLTLISALEDLFFKYPWHDFIFISGGCPKGADRFAKEIAHEIGVPILEHFPDCPKNASKKEFAAAAHARNRLIAKECDILIAMPAGTGGTESTIKYAEEFKKTVVLL